MVTENHLLKISEPRIAQHSFALTMHMDVTLKGRGRMNH